ncbi:hypothetical protein HDV01_004594, partial [Terramyces sp. JEL0728]
FEAGLEGVFGFVGGVFGFVEGGVFGAGLEGGFVLVTGGTPDGRMMGIVAVGSGNSGLSPPFSGTFGGLLVTPEASGAALCASANAVKKSTLNILFLLQIFGVNVRFL